MSQNQEEKEITVNDQMKKFLIKGFYGFNTEIKRDSVKIKMEQRSGGDLFSKELISIAFEPLKINSGG